MSLPEGCGVYFDKMDTNEICLLCKKPLTADGPKVVSVGRGSRTLIQTSIRLGDGLADAFRERGGAGNLRLHEACRKDYTRPGSIKKCTPTSSDGAGASAASKPMLRSEVPVFTFLKECFLCGEEANPQKELKMPQDRRRKIHMCAELDKIVSVKERALTRGDRWGDDVLQRLGAASDLVAADGRYHHDCNVKFFRNEPQGKAVGRPADEVRRQALQKLLSELESNSECQYTVRQLQDRLESPLPAINECGYTSKWLREKLKEHFGKAIDIFDLPGRPGVVMMHEVAEKIVHKEWYTQQKVNPVDEKQRFIEAAASILREEIQSIPYDLNTYVVDGSDIDDGDRVPHLLKTFVDLLASGKTSDSALAQRRRSVICDLIISAVRPRSFRSPIQLALGVHLHRRYGSRQVIDILHSLGMSVSYTEVQRCEHSLASAPDTEDNSDAFIQFAFDNADVNVRTLDGFGTFHNMGGIMIATPKSSEGTRRKTIDRIQRADKSTIPQGSIPVQTYQRPIRNGLSQVIVRDVEILSLFIQSSTTFQFLCLDTLWMSRYLLSADPCPSWNGYMTGSMDLPATDFDVSDIKILPFINLDPSNPSTIYTALKFAAAECSKLGQKICLVTFDQPLYTKATEIVASEGANSDLEHVVIRLGGFHTIMSYMGAIGHIMEGSGIEELWQSVYAKNSTTRMLDGHAYARALRAHFLTQLALYVILMRESSLFSNNDLKEKLQTYFEQFLKNEVTASFLTGCPEVKANALYLNERMSKEAERSKTGKLWIQYFILVEILRLYLRAERCGDWELHLRCASQMIPVFHAAGHLAYAKAVRLYVQQMQEIQNRFPENEIQRIVEKGYFTIRRTDKFWCGVSTDMAIENGLMRLMKVAGGLTHGRGYTEDVIANFIHAIPRCMPLSLALEAFVGVRSQTSEQHVELRESRMKRDRGDLDSFLEWFDAHPPFASRPQDELVSLSTGLIADKSVNCHVAIELGTQAMESITGKSFAEVKLKRTDKVKTIASPSCSMTIRGEKVEVNPQQLFFRLLAVLKTDENVQQAFCYELSTMPPSLFDRGLMRKPTKPAVLDALQKLNILSTPIEKCPVNSRYVLDGGYLLHVVVWQRPATFNDICQQYVSYVRRNFGPACTIVFDGYRGSQSTKSHEQSRRGAIRSSPNLEVHGHHPCSVYSTEFLSNKSNKAKLIDLLIVHLRDQGNTVLQAESDADVLIVETAFRETSLERPAVIVAQDTDIFVISAARCPAGKPLFLMLPGATSRAPARLYSISDVQKNLGELQDVLLFAHAATGCDTTSAPYNLGKKKAIYRLSASHELRQLAVVFNNPRAHQSHIREAGEKFFINLYLSDGSFGNMDELRYVFYQAAIARQSLAGSFKLSSLPPTSDALTQHLYRVFHQVQVWLGRTLPPTSWGWQVDSQGSLQPVPMTAQPAPDSLLKLISCGCKSGCRHNCVCRAAGVLCTSMCRGCRGVDCINCSHSRPEDADDPDDPEGARILSAVTFYLKHKF